MGLTVDGSRRAHTGETAGIGVRWCRVCGFAGYFAAYGVSGAPVRTEVTTSWMAWLEFAANR
jgi:hypothetical protein